MKAMQWYRVLFGACVLSSATVWAAPEMACKEPNKEYGFATCANIQAAKAEGHVVIYSPNIEQATARTLKAFEKRFPEIKTQYVRLQAGALYARLQAERRAGSHMVDVLNMSDRGLAEDFLKQGGYTRYMTPQLAAYEPRFRSKPEGYFTAGTLIMSGIAYNPNNIVPADVPKDWPDLNDPRWTGKVSVKSAASGVQYNAWNELKKIYGDDYWKEFSKLKPRPFDSYVQQFDRLINGEDAFAHTAQYSAYLEFRKKGAPVAFVAPKGGLPVIPEVWGVVDQAPNPQAARLFLDWLLSAEGQQVIVNEFFVYSPREDVTPPENGLPLKDMKLLTPESDEWDKFVAGRRTFVREWGRISGLSK